MQIPITFVEAGQVLRKGIKSDKVAETQKRKSKLSRGEMLRCRVRYFTRGAVIGSRDFVDAVFFKCKERFGERQMDDAWRRFWKSTGTAEVHG